MELVARKKLEIFVEQHALVAVEDMLGSVGFKGWSVFPSAEGAGAHGTWRQSGVGESGAWLVVAIGSLEAAEAALPWLSNYFKSYPGVVAVSDVAVIRGDRF